MIEFPDEPVVEPQRTVKISTGETITLPKRYDEQVPLDRILVASRTFHKGQLFGHLSAGGGSIVIGPNLSLRISAVNDDFRVIEVFQHSIGVKPVAQNYQQKKVVVMTPQKPVVQEMVTKTNVEEAEQAW